MPKVSIIIVSFNVRSYLVSAIDSILKSNYSNYEIIVVDNNSYDNTVDIVSDKYPNVNIISNDENVGFGKAVNQGAKIASGDYFLILNPDTIIEEDMINDLIEYIESNKNIGMVGPKILNSDGSLQLSCKRSFPTIKTALPKIFGLDKLFPKSKWMGRYNLTYLDPDDNHIVDAISGSCMLIKESVFRKINGFDERFFMFGEDIDICLRVWKENYQIHYYPKTKIIHYKGKSVKTAPYDSKRAFYHAMDLYVDKHYSSTLGVLSKFFIHLGIRLNKFLSTLSDKKSMIISLILDSIFITGAFVFAIDFRFGNFTPILSSQGFVPFIYVALWVSVYAMLNLYSRYILSYSRAFIGTVLGFLVAVLFTYFFNQFAYSRLVIITAFAIITFLIPGWRVFTRYLISRGYLGVISQSKSLLFSRKTIIAGSDEEGIRIAENILKRFDTGLDIIGYVDKRYPKSEEKLPIPFIGIFKEIRQLINTHKVNEVIFSSSALKNKEILDFMDSTRDLRLTYRMVPNEQDILLGKSNIEDIGGIPFINIEYNIFHKLHRFSKRIFDIIISVFVIILFAPLIIWFFILGKAIKIDFWGENAEIISSRIFDTKIKFLKDIPLLFNVLLGKISLVGSSLIDTKNPNPHILCKPGITGLDRIRNIKVGPDTRKAAEHYYIQNQNLKLDIEIIIKTLING